MAHAEKCPICLGRGTVPPKENCTAGYEETCYGCSGRGWVPVQDNENAYTFWPIVTTSEILGEHHF